MEKYFVRGFLREISAEGTIKSVQDMFFQSEKGLKNYLEKNGKDARSQKADRQYSLYWMKDGRELELWWEE